MEMELAENPRQFPMDFILVSLSSSNKAQRWHGMDSIAAADFEPIKDRMSNEVRNVRMIIFGM